MDITILIVLQGVFGGLISGVVFYASTTVRLQWLRRDVDFLLDAHTKKEDK